MARGRFRCGCRGGRQASCCRPPATPEAPLEDFETVLIIVQVVAVAVLAASVLESLRPNAWWPARRGRGSSPRERRWIHGGLLLVILGNLVNLRDPQDERTWAVALILLLAGVVAVVAGFVRGPSERDRERSQGD